MKRRITLLLSLILLALSIAGAPTLADERVTLVIGGPWTDCRALELIAAKFTAQNPGCEIKYEYIQDFENLIIRRLGDDEYALDLFLTNNILRGTPLTECALDLYSAGDALNLSDTFDGLLKNFTFMDEELGREVMYAIPLGAEMRGLFVNKTLLNSLGIPMPTNQAELFSACEILKAAGYMPFQGNPGYFGQRLLYPYICDIIANAEDYEAAHARVEAREPGVSEMFREPLEFLYALVTNYYYDYKAIENTTKAFTDSSDEGSAKSFLSIRKDENGVETVPDTGDCAFWPGALSQLGVLDKVSEDYHSPIEYEFILAPVSVEGGFAYMSPARGIAVNKRSSKLEWALKFMDFLFTPENNIEFAEAFNITPNVKDAFERITRKYGASADRISELGQVTFSYNFYGVMNLKMVDISKANNPKYMVDDGGGNLKIIDFEEFMAQLEANFEEARQQ